MDLIRLFLAGVVAVDHWRVLMLIPLSAFTDDHIKFGFNAGYAVTFSNLISVFLFAFSLQRNYTPGLDGIARFCRSRFVRIYSPYWPMVLLSFLIAGSPEPSFLAAALPDNVSVRHGPQPDHLTRARGPSPMDARGQRAGVPSDNDIAK